MSLALDRSRYQEGRASGRFPIEPERSPASEARQPAQRPRARLRARDEAEFRRWQRLAEKLQEGCGREPPAPTPDRERGA